PLPWKSIYTNDCRRKKDDSSRKNDFVNCPLIKYFLSQVVETYRSKRPNHILDKEDKKKTSSKTGDPDEMQRSILGQYFRVVELILTFGLVEYQTNRLITDYFEEGTDIMSNRGVNL